MSIAIDSINVNSDIKAFICNNKTGNPPLQREEFQQPIEIVVNGKVIKLD